MVCSPTLTRFSSSKLAHIKTRFFLTTLQNGLAYFHCMLSTCSSPQRNSYWPLCCWGRSRRYLIESWWLGQTQNHTFLSFQKCRRIQLQIHTFHSTVKVRQIFLSRYRVGFIFDVCIDIYLKETVLIKKTFEMSKSFKSSKVHFI